jgi:hypothetical protein
MFVCFYSVFVCRQRTCDGLIPAQGALPTVLGLGDLSETKRFKWGQQEKDKTRQNLAFRNEKSRRLGYLVEFRAEFLNEASE